MQCHGFCRHFYSSALAMVFIGNIMYFDFPLPSLPNLDLPISQILSLLPLCRVCVCKILTYLQIVLNQNSIFKRNLIYTFVPYPITLVGSPPRLWNGTWSPSGMLTSHKDKKTLVKALVDGENLSSVGCPGVASVILELWLWLASAAELHRSLSWVFGIFTGQVGRCCLLLCW